MLGAAAQNVESKSWRLDRRKGISAEAFWLHRELIREATKALASGESAIGHQTKESMANGVVTGPALAVKEVENPSEGGAPTRQPVYQ